ncbi:MAG: TIGR04282 family arsenosugar biosynthesis glycosyltransferase [Syntrophobacterales bacterium]|jgi:rSAM/selenodomain-associated transferase 1
MPRSPLSTLTGRPVLIIFAKEPRPGQVKTRLCPPLSPQAAARLYGQFLEDVLEEMAGLPQLPVAVAYAPEAARPFFQNLVAPDAPLVAQAGEDLGERLRQAFAWGFAQGAASVLIRNSDSPDLPGSLVLEAKEFLAGGRAQVVLGPCPDGGYYLVGLKTPQPRLFQDINWSSSSVLADTLAQAGRLGLKVHLLPSWLDIDTIADLQALVRSPRNPTNPGWRSYDLAKTLLAEL